MTKIIDIKTRKTIASIVQDESKNYPTTRGLQFVIEFTKWWFNCDTVVLGIVPAVKGGIPTVYAQPGNAIGLIMFWLKMIMFKDYKSITPRHFLPFYRERIQVLIGCRIVFCKELPKEIQEHKCE